MVQLHPVDPDEVNIQERVMETSAFKSMSVAKGHELKAAWEAMSPDEQREYLDDYQSMQVGDLVRKYEDHPLLAPSGGDSERRARVYGVLDLTGTPRKNPGAAAGALSRKGSKRVTPQALDAAFSQETLSPNAGMEALAKSLLPFMRDALLEDLITALQLVKQARGS